MHDRWWELVESLSRELVKKRVSHNLVRQVATYANRFPDAKEVLHWINLLETLGDTFSSGRADTTQQERTALKQTITPYIEKYPNINWFFTLSWVARLMVADSYKQLSMVNPRRIS